MLTQEITLESISEDDLWFAGGVEVFAEKRSWLDAREKYSNPQVDRAIEIRNIAERDIEMCRTYNEILECQFDNWLE